MRMDNNIAIEFDDVGKQYRLGLVGTGSLQHDLNRWWQTAILRKEDPYLKIGEVNDRSKKGTSDYVWALKDISFKVEQGDVVGIIGKNGAGKSTLLKLLSHITAPSVGHIHYRGRIASLLEVGTGFHPEMTARQNIYMNGSIMGMARHEITSKLDEIVDFAGIERYLDTPVKRFSSGMTVRLGFAVAAFLEPEILVVDEVLAVGDAEFQKKAIGKMQEISSGSGRTVLFVSHNMDSMLQLCTKGVLLENGMVKYRGTIQDTVSLYLVGENFNYTYHQNTPVSDIFVYDVRFIGSSSQEKGIWSISDKVKFEIKYRKRKEMMFDTKTVASICIMTSRKTKVCNVELSLSQLQNKDEVTFEIEYPSEFLMPGDYIVNASAHIPNIQQYDICDVVKFTVSDKDSVYIKYYGVDNGVVFVKPTIVEK